MTRYPQFNSYERSTMSDSEEDAMESNATSTNDIQVQAIGSTPNSHSNWISVEQDFISVQMNTLQSVPPFAIPKFYNRSNVILRGLERQLRVAKLTFNGPQIMVATMEGHIRRIHTSDLKPYPEDIIVQGFIVDIVITSNPNNFVVVCEDEILSVSNGNITIIHNEGVYLKHFKTVVGSLIIGKDGWLYELQEESGIVSCKTIQQLSTRIDTAAVVSNREASQSWGIMLVISNRNKIGLIRIAKENRKFVCAKVTEITTTLDPPLILAASTLWLFVATTSFQFFTAQENMEKDWSHFQSYAWNDLMRNFDLPTVALLPGQVVQSMSSEKDKLLISLMENRIVIYDANSIKKLYVIEIENMGDVVQNFNGFLIYTTHNKLVTRKLPKLSHVCPECLKLFDLEYMKYGNSITTLYVCKHFMKL